MSVAKVDVVVVGAGAAGIAAGRRVAAAGRSLHVLEARDRLGGRAFTRIDPRAGPLDLGCGWLHSANENPWVDVIERDGGEVVRGPTPWSRPLLESAFPMAEQDDYRAAATRLRERLARWNGAGGDRPVSDFLEPSSRWNGLLSAVSTYVSGAEPWKVSAADLCAYHDTGENWRVRGGYGAAIAAHGAGLPVTFGALATRIDHSGRTVRVESSRGTIETRAVILCVPASLIADGAIAFTPDLPAKRDAASGLPLGLADKLYFLLERPEEFEPESRIFGRTDSASTAAYHFRPLGRPVVEAYFGGECAAALERSGEAAFMDFALAELSALFGADIRDRLTPLPTHLWKSDSLARGSYSYAAPGRVGDRASLSEPVDGRLFFAGEACSARDYSTAHGAYLTGVSAADATLAALDITYS
jgi:monoamine oxidase